MFLYGSDTLDAYALLRRVLLDGYGLDTLPPIQKTPGGKPYFPTRPEIHFNVSHSGSFALCCVAESPVGADIERIVPRRDTLPQYVFSPQEFAYYQEQGGNWATFYTLWTLKESGAKQRGGGIFPPAAATIPLPPAQKLGELYFQSYEGEGFSAAVCAPNPPPSRIFWV
ncbi:MAG: 4'-phosphopantetheinyl transferase superfamily protein [Oscillospiraceae bacterium]